MPQSPMRGEDLQPAQPLNNGCAVSSADRNRLAGAARFPTVSDASAMADYPNVRNRERDALLSCVTWRPGMRVLDIQAAGGYLSDGVYARLNGCVQCLCIEPSPALRARLNPRYQAFADPVDHWPSIASASVDVVIGLVGLHHSASHDRTLEEALRVLKPGGQLAVCDVELASPVARWLNEFVDRHSPDGHQGRFLRFGYLSEKLEQLGLQQIWEARREVPWVFDSNADAARFFRGLFGLADIDEATLATGMREYLSHSARAGQVTYDWQLIYAYGRKPLSGQAIYDAPGVS